jgi:hypothetical protein
MSRMPHVDEGIVALQLLASANRLDPLERFISQLPEDPPSPRAFARETVRLRQELEAHLVGALTEDPRGALSHARWIAANVESITYRWASLIGAVKRWAQLDIGDTRFVLRREDP